MALLLAPGMLLFAVLALGFRPGERFIERLRSRRFARRATRAPRSLAARRPIFVHRRISPAASALAMRPPPAAPAPIS